MDVQWIDERDPRSYFGGRTAVEKYNNACIERRDKHPYILNDHKDTIEALNTDGFCILKDAFDVEKLLRLKEEAEAVISAGQHLKVNNDHWQTIEQPFLHCPMAVDIAFDDLLINIASEYFQCIPALGTFNLRKSLVNTLPEDTTNLFHADKNSVRFIKFFFYLNDVNSPEEGPLTIVEGSLKNKFLGWQHKYRWSEEEMKTIYGEDSFRYLTANVGDVIIANTTAFHRGTKVKTRNRTMLTLNYVIHPEEWRPASFMIKQNDYNDLPGAKKPVTDFLIKV